MRMVYTNPEIDIHMFGLDEVGTTDNNDPIYASSNAYNDAQKQVADLLDGQAKTASYIFTFE